MPADLSSQDLPPRQPRGHRGRCTAEDPGAPAPNSAGNAAPTRVATPLRLELQSPDGERPLPNTTRARGGRPAATVSRAAFARRRPPAAVRGGGGGGGAAAELGFGSPEPPP